MSSARPWSAGGGVGSVGRRPRAVPGRVHHAGHDDAGDGGHGGRQPALAAALGRHHLDARARAPRPSPCPARGRDAAPDAAAWLPCVRRGAARLVGPDRLTQRFLEVALDLAQAVPGRFLACMC
jgi:hypothetical protein